MITQTFGLKKEKKCFFVIHIPVIKVIEKTVNWINFGFWVSPFYNTNWAFMFLMQQSHVQWRVLLNLLCNANKLVLLEKDLENKDFASPTQINKLLVWAANINKTCILVMYWVIAYLQSDSEQPTAKYCIEIFQIFAGSDKEYGKNCY